MNFSNRWNWLHSGFIFSFFYIVRMPILAFSMQRITLLVQVILIFNKILWISLLQIFSSWGVTLIVYWLSFELSFKDNKLILYSFTFLDWTCIFFHLLITFLIYQNIYLIVAWWVIVPIHFIEKWSLLLSLNNILAWHIVKTILVYWARHNTWKFLAVFRRKMWITSLQGSL